MKNIYLIVAIIFVGCASTSTRYYMPYEKAYLKRISGYPQNFTVHKVYSDEMWARAQVFVSRYSGAKTQTANQYVIESVNATTLGYGYTYSITRASKGDSVEFSVSCFDASGTPYGQAQINRWACVDYMSTGYNPVESVMRLENNGFDRTTNSLQKSQERFWDTLTTISIISAIASLAAVIIILK